MYERIIEHLAVIDYNEDKRPSTTRRDQRMHSFMSMSVGY